MKNSFLNQQDQNYFDLKAATIHKKHRSQTVADVENLNNKYNSTKIFSSPYEVWNLIEKLSFVADPTDKELYSVSQWTHTLQVIEGMEKDGISDENMYVCGWLHDLGKILLLTDEDPANIVCDNYIIDGKAGAGLDNCVIQWNHDEFAFMKLKDHVEYKYSWLMRYHSINLKTCEQYFDVNDKKLVNELLIPFRKYDKGTKSIYNIPKIDLDKHRKVIEKSFLKPLEL